LLKAMCSMGASILRRFSFVARPLSMVPGFGWPFLAHGEGAFCPPLLRPTRSFFPDPTFYPLWCCLSSQDSNTTASFFPPCTSPFMRVRRILHFSLRDTVKIVFFSHFSPSPGCALVLRSRSLPQPPPQPPALVVPFLRFWYSPAEAVFAAGKCILEC